MNETCRTRRMNGCIGFLGLFATSLLGVAASPQNADAIERGEFTIRLERMASLPAPIFATHAGDGSGRLFIVDQGGKIFILKNGAILPDPFLDITALIPALNAGFDERGLLGVAFHPDFETNGRFFVRYSAPRAGVEGEPCFGTTRGCHEEILAEFHADPGSDVADPNGVILFRIDEPQFNHNAGQVEFGPDGFLYFSLGDGGGAHDGLADDPPSHGPIGNGQNINTALGSMLRIDVDGGAPYAIPPDNPFVNTDGLDEIYAYGFRNPYRFSFDSRPGGDGRLILADVGQALFEEIDVVTLGGNFGWVIKEGFHCFDPLNPTMPPAECDDEGLIDPIAEYSHADGGISVTGGFVYRGERNATLLGKYVFGDFSASSSVPSGRIYYLDDTNAGAAIKEFTIAPGDRPYGLFLKGFGQDENGELYALGSSAAGPFEGGVVERIVVVGNPGLDIDPGRCPNRLNLRAGGPLRVGLLGAMDFDVSDVDVTSIRLTREGFEGAVAPIRDRQKDVGTPFAGELCDCHDARHDGIMDIELRFDNQEVIAGLGLADVPAGEFVTLTVRGVVMPDVTDGVTTFNFDMDASQETAMPDSPGTGSCTVTLHAETGAVNVNCTYVDLVGTATAAHIHGPAPLGEDAGIIVPLTQSGGMSGTITGGGTLSAELTQAMLDGLTYVNLHTNLHPAGEIRGQIVGGGSFSASDCILVHSPGPPQDRGADGGPPRRALRVHHPERER